MQSSGGPDQQAAGSPREGWGVRLLRGGAGGRWLVWVARAVVWAFILVVVFYGVRAPFMRALQPAQSASSTTEARARYPTSAASAYALQFAHVYLNYQPEEADERARELQAYLPERAQAQLGWNGKGRIQLDAAQVAGVTARDARHGVVTLFVRVSDQWMRLSVPVYAHQGAMAISGRPALLPSPPEAKLPETEEPPTDPAAAAQLRDQLPGFFQAYAASDSESLARYLAPGVTMTGFSETLQFVSLDNVVVPAEGGTTRDITATVTWRLPSSEGTAGELQQTYELTVTKEDGRWYVQELRGAPSAGFS